MNCSDVYGEEWGDVNDAKPEPRSKPFDLRDSSVRQPSWVENSPVAVHRKRESGK